MILRKIIFCLVLLCIASYSRSQIFIPGISFNRIDKQSDSTHLTLYESIYEVDAGSFNVLNPLFRLSNNSNYPRGYNDGAVWRGEGITMEAHAGFQGEKGKFSYTLLPVFFFSENRNFSRRPNSTPFKYAFSNRIDWVEQYGEGSFTDFHFGQSELKFQGGKFIAAISTQNYSLGPSIYNPIILSRQAGGFPHLRIGLAPKEINIGNKTIGKIETNFIFGLIEESDYFDQDDANNERYINILAFAYNPSFLPNLTLGFNRSLYKQTRFFEPTDIFSTVFIVDNGVINGDTISVNDTFDQLASVTLDWNFKEVGFRAYAEFAKNDFTSDGGGARPTLVEPEHTRAFTIGFEKIVVTKKCNFIQFGYEHTNLSRNHAHLWRPTPSYYEHGTNRNGYTHNGQIIGSGLGPGGNSDHISVQLKYNAFDVGFLIQRIEHNRDYFVVNIANSNLHDIEYTISGFLKKEFEKTVLFAETSLSNNYNRNFLQDQKNISYGLGIQYKFN